MFYFSVISSTVFHRQAERAGASMSGSEVEGEEEEAGPAATAGRDDDTDQRGEEGQQCLQHHRWDHKPLRGQDGPGGAAVEGGCRIYSLHEGGKPDGVRWWCLTLRPH